MSSTLDLVRTLAALGDVLGSSHGYDALDEDGILFEDLLASLPDAETVKTTLTRCAGRLS